MDHKGSSTTNLPNMQEINKKLSKLRNSLAGCTSTNRKNGTVASAQLILRTGVARVAIEAVLYINFFPPPIQSTRQAFLSLPRNSMVVVRGTGVHPRGSIFPQ